MSEKKRKRRMTLPKKREDIEKVVEEVAEGHSHGHEHEHEHHHHHHHGDVDELLTVIELLLDSTNATVKVLDSKVKQQANEIATIYRVLAKIVEACMSSDEESKRSKLLEALKILGASIPAGAKSPN